MFERARGLISRLTGRADDRRFVSRVEREERQRRILIFATAAVALAVVVALVAGAIWQYFLVPRETYATVNGVDIRRVDYEKFRIYTLLQQITSLSNQVNAAPEDQRAALQQQVAALQLELQDLEGGDKNINPEALEIMIQDQLVLQGLDDFGLVVTDAEVEEFVDQLLAPVPLSEPTATLTIPPTAAAWATETIDAFFEQSTSTAEELETQTVATSTAQAEAAETAAAQPSATPGEDATPPEGATAAETPAADGTPTADAQATTEARATELAGTTPTPDPDAGPTFTPVPTLEPTATPNREEAIETSEASFELLEQNFLDRADMSRGDFERLIARPQLARQKLAAELIQDIPTSQDQVRASHILVATRDAALELIDTRLQNEDFATVAEEVSTDSSSAINGGDLGWFTRDVMATPFEEVAFSLDVDEMSEPVQTEFGWHIILVTDREDDRPLTVSTLNTLRQTAVSRWVQDQQASASISASVPLPTAEIEPPNLGGF